MLKQVLLKTERDWCHHCVTKANVKLELLDEKECLLHCCGFCWDKKSVVHRGTEIDVSFQGLVRVNSCDHEVSFSFSFIIRLRPSVVCISFAVGLPSIILTLTIPRRALWCAYPARARVMGSWLIQHSLSDCSQKVRGWHPVRCSRVPVRSAPWCPSYWCSTCTNILDLISSCSLLTVVNVWYQPCKLRCTIRKVWSALAGCPGSMHRFRIAQFL